MGTDKTYQNYLAEYELLIEELSNIKTKQKRLQKLKTQIQLFKEKVRQSGKLLNYFDADVWNAVTDHAVVNSDGVIMFVFRYGAKIPWHKSNSENQAR